jgi:hypothetical protein
MVGGFSGWTNYDPKLDATPNYQEWAASLTIEINDTLGKQLHDIHSFSSIFFFPQNEHWRFAGSLLH